MDIYSLVQKLPEDLVRVIASYDPTKELRRKQLKESFDGIHSTAKWCLDIPNFARGSEMTLWHVISLVTLYGCCHGHYNDWNYSLRTKSKYKKDRDFAITLETDQLQCYIDVILGTIGGIRGNIDIGVESGLFTPMMEDRLTLYEETVKRRLQLDKLKYGDLAVTAVFANWRKIKTEPIPREPIIRKIAKRRMKGKKRNNRRRR